MEPSSAPPVRRWGPLVAAGVVAALILGIVAVGLVLTADGGADDGVTRLTDPGASSDAPPDRTTDEPAPDGAFDYWDGEPGTLADFGGRPLVVNFFASWCVPCVDEMPEFEAVHQELGDQVQFLGMNFQDRRDDAQGIIDHTGITYPVARDDGDLLEAFDGVIMPTTAFITADGRVVRVHNGPMTADQLRSVIDDELLG